MLFGYATTIFLSSACLLVLEIVASRLLAPYVGVSLYTWTAIIGVILAGLSLGNWLGGWWADHGAGVTAAGLTLVASGMATLAAPMILMLIADTVQQSGASLVGASLLYVSALFAVPALVLGVITPLLTTLALAGSQQPGRVVGGLHALAALGSICGTFVTGFYLVPWFGTRNIVIGTGIVLLAMGLCFLLRRPRTAALAVALSAALLVTLAKAGALRNPCDTESLYYCIRVVDEPTPYGPVRTLVLDHMVHSHNHVADPTLLVATYAHLMDEMMRQRLGRSPRVFYAGGGAYTQPRALRARLPDAHIEVAEIDPAVTETARQRLFAETDRFLVHDTDARIVLPRTPAQGYDAIVTDVFHDVAVPFHLTTAEYADMVASRLTADGLYLVNLVDVFPDSRLVKAMVKTLRGSFRHVQAWLESPPDRAGRITYVVSATNGEPFAPRLAASHGLARTWFDVVGAVESVGTPMREIPRLSDDHAPVERLVSTLFWSEMGL